MNQQINPTMKNLNEDRHPDIAIMNWKVIVIGLFGGIFLILGVALPLVFPMIFESKLNEKLVITPGGPALKSFTKTPIPIYFKVYFYNVTNAEDILYGDKPILQELGPYTYLQERYKHNLTWNHENGTVFYQEQKIYHFVPEMSNGSEHDIITTVNPVYITLASKGDSLNYLLRTALYFYTLSFDFQPFMTHKLSELTFDGYHDEVVVDLYEKSGNPKYKEGKAGYFYGKNGSVDEGTDIFSGELGMENYQHIYKWHGQTELDFWKTKESNMINGTYGSQFPRPIDTTAPLYMFTSDLCRSIYLRYEKDVEYGALTLHRFSITPDALGATEDNMAFCRGDFTCRSSMIDVSKCRDGAPIVMSTPHFYLGSADDLEMFDGVSPPTKEEHETYLDIEPNTGVPLRANKGMQVNVAFRPSTTLSDLEDVEPIIFPILWVNEGAVVPIERVNVLAATLTGPKTMANYLAGGLIAAGILLILVASVIHCWKSEKKNISGKRQESADKTNQDVSMNLMKAKNGTEKA